jgi:hypothetical protein
MNEFAWGDEERANTRFAPTEVTVVGANLVFAWFSSVAGGSAQVLFMFCTKLLEMRRKEWYCLRFDERLLFSQEWAVFSLDTECFPVV